MAQMILKDSYQSMNLLATILILSVYKFNILSKHRCLLFGSYYADIMLVEHVWENNIEAYCSQEIWAKM